MDAHATVSLARLYGPSLCFLPIDDHCLHPVKLSCNSRYLLYCYRSFHSLAYADNPLRACEQASSISTKRFYFRSIHEVPPLAYAWMGYASRQLLYIPKHTPAHIDVSHSHSLSRRKTLPVVIDIAPHSACGSYPDFNVAIYAFVFTLSESRIRSTFLNTMLRVVPIYDIIARHPAALIWNNLSDHFGFGPHLRWRAI